MKSEYLATTVPPGDVPDSVSYSCVLMLWRYQNGLVPSSLGSAIPVLWSYCSSPGKSVMPIQIPLRHQKRADYRVCEDQPKFASDPFQQPWWEKNQLQRKAQLMDAGLKLHPARISGQSQQPGLGAGRCFLENFYLFYH